MKILLEPTLFHCQLEDGHDLHVWKGETESGTPVEVAIYALRVNSDDPVQVARFKLEYALHGEPHGRA